VLWKAGKWVKRYRLECVAGLRDRSCRPRRSPRRKPDELAARVEALRRQRWTGARIALELKIGPATVSRILRRLGLNRIRDIEPQPPIVRYEHEAPGDMLHLDIKRLVRIQRPSHRVTGDRRDGVKGIGAEFLHIAIDDHSRIAFTAMYPDQSESSATHFLYSAVAWYARLGIDIRRVLTDNGRCYTAHNFNRACGDLGIQHKRTRPCTPTERPNASSKPLCANGLTPGRIRTRSNEPKPCYPSTTSTTGIDHMPESNKKRPSPEQDSMTTIS